MTVRTASFKRWRTTDEPIRQGNESAVGARYPLPRKRIAPHREPVAGVKQETMLDPTVLRCVYLTAVQVGFVLQILPLLTYRTNETNGT